MKSEWAGRVAGGLLSLLDKANHVIFAQTLLEKFLSLDLFRIGAATVYNEFRFPETFRNTNDAANGFNSLKALKNIFRGLNIDQEWSIELPYVQLHKAEIWFLVALALRHSGKSQFDTQVVLDRIMSNLTKESSTAFASGAAVMR
ncbi:hypothetical protein HDU93_005557 [Gonapodya sp. JEL0774]|nr:hypothetical protein HDU93_005557 [Gonapodya sp. JEL0774]